MNNKNVKVIDEHNIDRNASIMFAVDLNGSEYVVYWIERDEVSNNVFVSKVLKNLDGTYNMLNIDDPDKKKEVSEVIKILISDAVNDQNDKMIGTTKILSNGDMVKFLTVSFNKEQNINVPKTYITTVKKEVTKVVEGYYDIVLSESQIEPVLTPVIDPESIFVSQPEVVETITNVVPPVVEAPVVDVAPVVVETVVTEPVVEVKPASMPVLPSETPVVASSQVITPVVNVEQPIVTVPTPVEVSVVETTTSEAVTPVVSNVEVNPETVITNPVVGNEAIVAATTIVTAPTEVPVVPATPLTSVSTPVVNEVKPEVEVPVIPTPVVTAPLTPSPNVENQPLVFNASKETNLNAALGEVANSNNVAVENITVVREFGQDTPVPQQVQQPAVVQMVQSNSAVESQVIKTKGGFANSKFFMFVAIAFFMASCVFLGYEVYNYFQIANK